MLILNGKEVSDHLKNQIKTDVQSLKQRGIEPCLAVVLVGQNPASQVYVANKAKACVETGILPLEYKLDENISASELKAVITKLNNDPKVHGILVQLPLPAHLNSDEVLSWVDPKKDADCLTTENVGLFYSNHPRVTPCTPTGVMKILEYYKIPIKGQVATVVGRSAIVGKPMFQLLLNAQATVTICHSQTKDIKHFLKQSDIVVVAIGKPEFFSKDDFKKDSVIIDVGIHRVSKDSKKLCGDVKFEGLDGVVKAATPVPGGVGPMTIACLLENTIKLASR